MENGFGARLEEELLNGKVFYLLLEIKILNEQWCHQYNNVRPYIELSYHPPAPEGIITVD
tara:strand:- start:31544 stop:31723 length:180 start_codon:yes stop_codon:yes gene_type:complete